MYQKQILILFIVALTINVALACNGFKAEVVKAKNCGNPDAIITVDDGYSVKLNEKCEVVFTGCIINKAFNTAVAKYKLIKNGELLIAGDIDMCTMASSELGKYSQFFGAPASCPAKDGKVCGDELTMDFSKYKFFLNFAVGSIIFHSNIEHDTGSSCLHFQLQITKD